MEARALAAALVVAMVTVVMGARALAAALEVALVGDPSLCNKSNPLECHLAWVKPSSPASGHQVISKSFELSHHFVFF